MANYLVTLLFPTTARSEAQTVATAITGTDHSAAFPAGNDYTGGSSNKTPVHLTLTDEQVKYALALALQSLNCRFIVRSSSRVVIESQIDTITAASTFTDAQIRTAMQTTFAELSQPALAVDNVTLWGVEFYVKSALDPLPGFIDASQNSVFAYTGGATSNIAVMCVRDDAGTYYGSEIKSVTPRGYGTYRFSSAGRVNNLGSNITFGMFNYASDADGGVNPYEEGGYEIGGVVSGDTCHMYHYRDDTLAVNVAQVFDPGSDMIFHWEYVWTADKITWRVFSRDNDLLFTASSGTGVDDFIGATWRFNAWAFTGIPSAEVRLAIFDYSFTAA